MAHKAVPLTFVAVLLALAGCSQPTPDTDAIARAVLATLTAVAPRATETSVLPTALPTPVSNSGTALAATQGSVPTVIFYTDIPTPTSMLTSTPPKPTASRVRVQPSPSPMVVTPLLLDPAPGLSRSGRVTFRWEPSGPLPAGAAYEVVMWNSGEDPASARGVAATTADTSLTVDLDALDGAGLLKRGETFWTVLIVKTDPYVRLSQPAEARARPLIYQASGGGGGGPVEPPKP